MRVPRITGLPEQIAGLTSIRSIASLIFARHPVACSPLSCWPLTAARTHSTMCVHNGRGRLANRIFGNRGSPEDGPNQIFANFDLPRRISLPHELLVSRGQSRPRSRLCFDTVRHTAMLMQMFTGQKVAFAGGGAGAFAVAAAFWAGWAACWGSVRCRSSVPSGGRSTSRRDTRTARRFPACAGFPSSTAPAAAWPPARVRW